MLSNYNIWLVPLVALFFACLNVGSIQLPMVLQLDSSLSGVIQGAMVLAALGVHAWRRRWTLGIGQISEGRKQKAEDRKQ
jgi:simple sugar transport system permease protein